MENQLKNNPNIIGNEKFNEKNESPFKFKGLQNISKYCFINIFRSTVLPYK